MKTPGILLVACGLAAGVAPAAAQLASTPAARVYTAADYARAERFLGYNVNPLVSNGPVRPNWIAGTDRFWYRNQTANGSEIVVVDPARRTREVVSAPPAAAAPRPDVPPNSILSPDSTKAAFIRDWNLWVRDLATGVETQLTTDGVTDFGYATDNAGWIHSDRPILLWSPDSKKIATFQQDERHVGEMYLVTTRVGHPVLQEWRYPLPGDSVIAMIRRVVIDMTRPTPRVIRLQMPPDPHRSTLCDHITCNQGAAVPASNGRWADVEWTPDGNQLVFVSTARDHRHEWVRVADARTGQVREVFDETDPHFLESGFNHINWHALPATHELIWYSERSDWGHLYLYDLATGRLENPITSGAWKVLALLHEDDRNRTLWFTAAGREGGDPYYRRLYSVRMDGSRLTLLTPENADHDVTFSPSGRYFVDNYSTPDSAGASVLRDSNGRVVMPLERTDISRLLAAGWRPPVPFTVKARDGHTDLYGLMFLPTDFDSTRVYPMINHIYPGPQTGSVGSRQFLAARGDDQALAELGFAVVELDAMGTPMRSHRFMAAYYGDMGDNGLPDQVAGMKELARRYRWLDSTRVGIWGHSGGGFAAADAMLRYGDFFQVGISEAGNHDQREYEDDWGEKWQGLLTTGSDGTTNYDDQANQDHAAGLKGHLLIAHGTTDDNVPPYNTLLLVDSLIAHNKDFDLLLLPNRRHGFGNEPYMIRRRWDYFVRWLGGGEPPHEYALHPPAPAGR